MIYLPFKHKNWDLFNKNSISTPSYINKQFKGLDLTNIEDLVMNTVVQTNILTLIKVTSRHVDFVYKEWKILLYISLWYGLIFNRNCYETLNFLSNMNNSLSNSFLTKNKLSLAIFYSPCFVLHGFVFKLTYFFVLPLI